MFVIISSITLVSLIILFVILANKVPKLNLNLTKFVFFIFFSTILITYLGTSSYPAEVIHSKTFTQVSSINNTYVDNNELKYYYSDKRILVDTNEHYITITKYQIRTKFFNLTNGVFTETIEYLPKTEYK